MALLTEPTYSDFDQFKTYTPIAAQVTIDEATEWKPLALQAQFLIDTYVRTDLGVFNSDQDSIFPLAGSDGVIPDEVTLAHIYLTSFLIDKGEPSASDVNEATQESWSGTGYSRSSGKSSSERDPMVFVMPPSIRRLLKQWSGKGFAATY